MNKNDIIKSLSQKIAVELLNQPDRDISANELLISSGLIDSFSLVDLSILVEDNYGVLIDDSELNADTFDTLEKLSEIIAERMA
ncbi:MAG: acyl carrier protein [Anaerolineaceae bacterium]|nr:acyl carrier protein [Anaerolineaceae bacterium]